MASGSISTRPQAESGPAGRYEDFIQKRVEHTRRQVRLVDVGSNLILLAAASLFFFLAVALADHWVFAHGLNFFARLLLWGAWLGIAGTFAWRFIAPALMHRINPVFAAQAIEHGRPALKNSLINFLMLRSHPENVAPVVYRAMEHRAAVDLAKVPADQAVDHKRLIHLSYVLTAAVALFALYLAFSPKNPLLSAARVIWPWASIPAPTRVHIDDIQPGNAVVFRGDPQNVSAHVSGLREGEEVWLLMTTADGLMVDEKVLMTRTGDDDRYACDLPPGSGGMQQDTLYRLAAGDAATQHFKLETRIAPTIIVEHVDYHFPSYTALADRNVKGQGDIQALEGTRVTIHAKANMSIKTARIDLGKGGLRSVPMKIAGQTATGEFTLALETPGAQRPEYDEYQVYFTDIEDRPVRHPIRYQIVTQPDLKPEVAIVKPESDPISVAPSGHVAIRVHAQDVDFALRRVSLHATVRDQVLDLPVVGKMSPTMLDRTPPDKAATGAFDADYIFSPAQIKGIELKAGDDVMYWAEAEDNREPKRNIKATDKHTIHIVSEQASQQGQQEKGEGDGQKQGNGGAGQEGNGQGQPQAGENGKGNESKEPSKGDDPSSQNKASPDDKGGKSQDSKQGSKGDKGDSQSGQGGKQASTSEQGGDNVSEPSASKSEQKPTPRNTETERTDAIKDILKDKEAQDKKQQQQNPQQSANNQPKDPQNNSKDGNQGGQSQPNAQSGNQPNSQPNSQNKSGSENGGGQQSDQQSPNTSANKPQNDQSNSGQPQGKENGSGQNASNGPQPNSQKQDSANNNQPGQNSPQNGGNAPQQSGHNQQAASAQPQNGPKQGNQPDGQSPQNAANQSKGQGNSGSSQPQQGTNSTAQNQPDAKQGGGKSEQQNTAAGGQQPQDKKQGGGQAGDKPQTAGGQTSEKKQSSGQSSQSEQELAMNGGKPEKNKASQGGDSQSNSPSGGNKPGEKPKNENGSSGGGSQGQQNKKEKQEKDGGGGAGGQEQPKSGKGDQPDSSGGGGKQSPKGQPSGKPGNSDDGPRQQDPGKQGDSQLDSSGSPDSQADPSRTGNKVGDAHGKSNPSDPSKSPDNSPHKSDSSSNSKGDKKGGGGEGGGQPDKKTGKGAPGSTTDAATGGSVSNQKGGDANGKKAGEARAASNKTNSPKQEAGQGGGEKREPPNDQSANQDSQKPSSNSTKNTDPNQQTSAGGQTGSQSPAPGGQGSGPPSGGSANSGQTAAATPDKAAEEKADEADLTFSKKQVDLALNHLQDELKKQKPELLDKLGWSKEDAQRFVDNISKLRDTASRSGNASDKRAYNEFLKNLGLHANSTRISGGGTRADDARIRDAGQMEGPAEWADLTHAYSQSTASEKK